MGRLESAIKEFKIATSLNSNDALGWFNLYNCYKEVNRMEDAEDAYRTYEKLMKTMGQDQDGSDDGPKEGQNPSNIPGGVSQTGGYSGGGGDMSGNAPGMETLADDK